MGIVRMGPPEDLVLLLTRSNNISLFVETGTFEGGTAKWASRHFKSVVTIEKSKTYFDDAVSKYGHLENIEFRFGDSRMMLEQIVTTIHEPALFWLDAHWCGMDSYGVNDQCPIIEEINIICSSGINHYILIDDARLFLSPPPLPNIIDQWPAIDQLLNSFITLHSSYYLSVFEDVIIAVPDNSRTLVADFCQAANTKAEQEYGKNIQSSQSCLTLINQGIRAIIGNFCSKIKSKLY